MINTLMGTVLTVIRFGVTGKDPLGKVTTGEISRTDVLGRLEQRGSEEGDAYVVNAFQGYLPIGTEVRERDVILDGSRKLEVEGTASHNRIPGFPGADHVLVNLKYVGVVS